MRYRYNNSIQSSNTPSIQNRLERSGEPDHSLYRCMVTDTKLTDADLNLSAEATNPRVLYDVVIMGGERIGQVISNCRVLNPYASTYAYYERTLRASSKELKEVQLDQHDGEVVFVKFINGDKRYPVIVGYDEAIEPLAKEPATEQNTPREIKEFNGIREEKNKDGEFKLEQFGGEVDPELGTFVPSKEEDPLVTLYLTKEEAYQRTFKSGLSIVEDGLNDKVEITTGSGTKISVDGTADTVEVKDSGTGTLKITGNTVALGAEGVEVLQQISDSLDKILNWAQNIGATHDHVGNLGYPTAPPTQAADYIQLATDLTALKSDLDSIKGSL